MNTKNTSWIQKHTNLHLSRCEGIDLLIDAILKAKTVNLAHLALFFKGEAEVDSKYKRIVRLINEIEVDPDSWIKMIFSLLPKIKKPVQLIMDRTCWTRGGIDYNFLFLAIKIEDICLPLCFESLESNKGGNSNLEERMKTILAALRRIRADKIEVVLGDREFGSINFMQQLRNEGVKYCFRLKDDWNYIHDPKTGVVSIPAVVNELEVGQKAHLHQVLLGKHNPVKTDITVLKLEGSIVVVAHSPKVKNPETLYRKRWSIEMLFKFLKSGFFNMEDMNIKKHHAIVNLIYILCLAVALLFQEYLMTERLKPGFRKRPPDKSVFRLALELIQQLIDRLSHHRNPAYLLR